MPSATLGWPLSEMVAEFSLSITALSHNHIVATSKSRSTDFEANEDKGVMV